MQHTMTAIRKAADIAEAQPGAFTAIELKNFLDDLALEERKPLGESLDSAFARVATKTELGRRLFKALRSKVASGEADHDAGDEEPATRQREEPPMTPALRQLYDLADDHRKENPTKSRAQSFAAIMHTPRGTALYRQHKAELAQQ